jgi:hypothetical protein
MKRQPKSRQAQGLAGFTLMMIQCSIAALQAHRRASLSFAPIAGALSLPGKELSHV